MSAEDLISLKKTDKYKAELSFWEKEIKNYEEWYEGELKLYNAPIPQEYQKVKTYNLQRNAMLTWLKLWQEPKYLKELLLDKRAFVGLKVLEIGSGPVSGALVFEDCELYCIDPLLEEYIKIGYPIDYYKSKGVKFINEFAECMPIEDNFIDAVISINSIDHVDDIYKTALEIKRVLKPGGKIRIHTQYHEKYICEPLELNDSIMKKAFSWCHNFRKIKESNQSLSVAPKPGQIFVLWSNF